MSRTLRATLIGALSVGVTVVVLGVMLGFSTQSAVVTGAVFGGLMGLVIWAASRRADTFYAPDEDGPMKESTDG